MVPQSLTKESVQIAWAVCLTVSVMFFSLALGGALGGDDAPLSVEVKCPNGLEFKMSGMYSVNSSSLIDRCNIDSKDI